MSALEIIKAGELFKACIKSSGSVVWKTTREASRSDIDEALRELGFHQTDIADAFAFAEGEGINMPHPLLSDEK